MSTDPKTNKFAKIAVITFGIITFTLPQNAMSQDIEPGAMSPNQAIAIIAASLPAGVALNKATPAQIQAAVYAATRATPFQASAIVGAVLTALPQYASVVNNAANSALSDAQSSGEVSSNAAKQLTSTVKQQTSPKSQSSAPSKGFFPSATSKPSAPVSTGTGSVTAIQSGS